MTEGLFGHDGTIAERFENYGKTERALALTDSLRIYPALHYPVCRKAKAGIATIG